MRPFIAFCSFILFIWIAIGQTTWQSLQGPMGGSIRELYASDHGFIYGATQENLFRRAYGDAYWSLIEGPPHNYPIQNVVIYY